ncbi:hypothetical protein HII31_13662, partial [Pseudocercospora fuligena]
MAPLAPHAGHVGLVLPLCTTAATVGLSLYQYPVFMSFLQEGQTLAGRPLSRFWEPLRIITSGNKMSEQEADKANREEMKTWLTIHTARLLLVDLPALWCFAEGTALSFWVGP